MKYYPLSVRSRRTPMESPLDSIILILSIFLNSCGFTADVVKRDDLRKMTPSQALQRLEEGNARFTRNNLKNYRLDDQRYYLGKNNAHPPAVVLCGPDARVAPELIFNQGLGDVYCLRSPASIVTGEIVAAMEHACRDIGSKVIVVLMQTHDPYIDAVIDNNMLGNLAAINFQLRPTLDNIKRDPNWKRWRKEELFNLFVREQLLTNTLKVSTLSPILRSMAERGEINIVSGIYNIETGKVVFLKGDE